jgi:hypothetical protein
MSFTLRQSTIGGSVSSSGTSPYTLTTSAAGFSSNTISGSFLVLVAYDKEHAHTAGQFSGVSLINPTTSGITWTSSIFNSWHDGPSTNGGGFQLWYAANAPSISSATTSTVQGSIGGAGAVSDLSVEFALYEFTGVKLTSPVDVTRNSGNTTGTVSANGNITTTQSDLIIVVFSGNDPNITAGSGYILGTNMVVATTGQLQYQLGSSIGSTSTSFGGSQTNYSASAVAFKAQPTTGFISASFVGL